MSKTPSSSPWHVPLAARDVPAEGLHLEIVAEAAARDAVAAFAGVQGISRLEARFDVARYRGEGLHVSGEVSAAVDQRCVVTLEPMTSEIVEPIDLVFLPPGLGASAAIGGEADASADEPETLIDGAVDLGAIATEFLILGIDPYPRKPDAVFAAPAAEGHADNPFAVLAALKEPHGGE
jgi:uncharacterized metal-binding protein YceD (DUF177 family)